MLEAAIGRVVAELTENVEDGLLLFGREFVVASVVSPEVGLAAVEYLRAKIRLSERKRKSICSFPSVSI